MHRMLRRDCMLEEEGTSGCRKIVFVEEGGDEGGWRSDG